MKTFSLKLESPWEEVKEKLKENNITLSDEDLNFLIPGEEKELINHLSQKINRSPEEVKAIIESISYNEGMAS